MNREQLEELGQDELIELAKNEYGLDVDRRYGEEKLRTLILSKAGNASSNKHVAQAFTGFPDENGEFVVPPGGAVVEIQTNYANPYKRPVPLGVNGKFIYAPVETPICLAGKYIEVLRNAVREETSQRKERGEMVTHYNTKASYPFSVMYENKTEKTQKIQV